ncbi:hypothetical protein [Roseimarinus sediminis]|uniref:hypothetical protein n=1 Tax=Roseimarinus sediminis TaxID=1610899 RepID=UPI003D22F02E
MNKIIRIILPHTISTILFFIVCSSLYWLFTIELELISYDNILFCNILPGAISLLLVFVFLRKRLELLNISYKYKFVTLILTWILMAVPLMNFELYLHWSNSEQTIINQPSDLLENRNSRYYTIKKSDQLKEKSGKYFRQGRAVREHEMRVNCYFVCPLTDISDNKMKQNIWIGLNLSNSFSDRVFDDKTKQEKLISNYIDSCILLYDSHNFNTNFLKNLTTPNERKQFIQAIENSKVEYDDENLIILEETINDYLEKAKKSLQRTKLTFIVSILLWILLTVFPKMKNTL